MSIVITFKRRDSQRSQFEALMRPHFDSLYSAARRLTLSTIDAEDLVQDVCLKAFLRIDELRQIKYQRAWLLKVLYHQFIDGQRSNQRSPLDIAETGVDSEEPNVVAGSAWQPEEIVDLEKRIDRVLKAMRCLDKEQCALVALHDVEGLTIDELRELTGMPKGTIKSQLHRTRARLGRLLSNDANFRPHLRLIGGKK